MSTIDVQYYDNFLKTPEAVRDYALSMVYRTHEHMGNTVAEAPVWQDYQTKFGQPGKISFFRMGDGKKTSTWVHSDKSVGVKTSILYLSKSIDNPLFDEDGTRFCRHKSSGLLAPADNKLYDFTLDEYRDPAQWEEVKRVKMKFNRLIYYDSRYFHSRLCEEHWSGRLVQVVFF